MPPNPPLIESESSKNRLSSIYFFMHNLDVRRKEALSEIALDSSATWKNDYRSLSNRIWVQQLMAMFTGGAITVVAGKALFRRGGFAMLARPWRIWIWLGLFGAIEGCVERFTLWDDEEVEEMMCDDYLLEAEERSTQAGNEGIRGR